MSAVSAPQQAVVPYNPDIPHVRAYIQAADLAARNQLEASKLNPVLPSATGPNPIRHSGMFFTPPAHLPTDLFLGVEIFRPDTDEKKPILIFSHGLGADPVRYRSLLKEIASQGYVVLSITHPSAVEDLDLSPKEEQERVSSVGYRMANNIEFVLGQVRHGALQGVGDTSKIFLGGHSLGGAASINVARNNPAIKGCMNLDGFLHGNRKTERVRQPLLMMIGDHQGWVEAMKQSPVKAQRDYAESCSQSLEAYETLRRNSDQAEKIVVPDGTHMDFSDAPFHELLQGTKSLDAAMRVHTLASQKMVQFMNGAALF